MKVSIGSQIIKGPWGGGNLFVTNLTNYLQDKGHKVLYNLSESDIDLIILTDPRSRKESTSTFNHIEIEKYKNLVNKNVKVVQRINECDERKGTNNINDFYLKVSESADHVTFVSAWLEQIYLKLGMDNHKTSVILAGADSNIFNNQNIPIKKNSKIKLLTHHWSSHENKGFKTYKTIDNLLSLDEWKEKIEFTYIGNMPDNYIFNNTKIIRPLAGKELAEEIKKHDIYVTGSINEPSGNHHIEAAQCGLPILYLESGGIPEYCKSFGVSFKDDFVEKLVDIIKNYEQYKNKLAEYPHSSKKMCDEYYELFEKLLDENNILKTKTFKLGKLPFLLKHKFYKIFRDRIYFNFKSTTLKYLRKLRKK